MPKTRDPRTLRGKPSLRKRWRDPRTPAERGVVRDAVFALLRERGVADDPFIVEMARRDLIPRRDGQKLYAPAIRTLGDIPDFERFLDDYLEGGTHALAKPACPTGDGDRAVEAIAPPPGADELLSFVLSVLSSGG